MNISNVSDDKNMIDSKLKNTIDTILKQYINDDTLRNKILNEIIIGINKLTQIKKDFIIKHILLLNERDEQLFSILSVKDNSDFKQTMYELQGNVILTYIQTFTSSVKCSNLITTLIDPLNTKINVLNDILEKNLEYSEEICDDVNNIDNIDVNNNLKNTNSNSSKNNENKKQKCRPFITGKALSHGKLDGEFYKNPISSNALGNNSYIERKNKKLN